MHLFAYQGTCMLMAKIRKSYYNTIPFCHSKSAARDKFSLFSADLSSAWDKLLIGRPTGILTSNHYFKIFATILILIAQNLFFILVRANVFLNSMVYLGWLEFKGAHHFCYQDAEQICLNNHDGGVCVWGLCPKKEDCQICVKQLLCLYLRWTQEIRDVSWVGYDMKHLMLLLVFQHTFLC